MKTSFNNFFKDKNGKVVILQKPNLYIWLAIGLYLTNYLFTGTLHVLLALGVKITLIAWAADETLRGDSPFRKVLGVLILILLILNILILINL